MIVPSVITSSSNWRLGDLVRDVRKANPACKFDLFILREVDIEQCERPSVKGGPRSFLECDPKGGSVSDTNDDRALAGIMGAPGNGNLTTLLTRLDLRLGNMGDSFRGGIAALATYFPWISSLEDERRKLAVRAIVQTVRFAFGAARHERQWMATPIVEIVCGNLIESCRCEMCRKEKRVFLAKPEEKRERLLQSLREIVWQIKQYHPTESFALALELEPGPSYVLNNREALRLVLEQILKDELLKKHVGLNLDIAHMRLANVSAEWLEEKQLVSQIVHAHICDHPRMHTRDQPLGAWTSTYTHGQFYDYLDLLFQRAEQWDRTIQEQSKTTGDPQLPFSGAVAIELEGSNQISWIHRSVNRLSRMIRVGSYRRGAASGII